MIARNMDFGPMFSRPNAERYDPDRMKNAISEAKTAPPFTTLPSALIFMYERLME